MGGPTWRSPAEELLRRGAEPPAAVRHGAATYFADLSAPRGDRHVRVCTGTACFVASGGDPLTPAERVLGVRAGQCSDDGTVSLQEAHCLGYCYGGPAALDGDQPCAGPDLADQLAGRVPRRAPDIPVAAGGSGLLVRSRDPDEGWQCWRSVVADPDGARRVLAEVTAAGLRGRGGAGFPTARKWEALQGGADGGQRFVVANGDEGDPGSFADRWLMEERPDLVLEGLALAALACGATRGVAYVRSEYPAARTALLAAVERARRAGHLGVGVHGSGVDLEIDVVSGHGSYVAGEETSLLASLSGLRGTVRVRPPYPTEHGFRGRPTAVNNVETLATVPDIVARGGAAYAELGTATESGSELVSLNERFTRPGLYEVELGTTLRTVVEELGGGLRQGSTLRAVQVGGPLGGFVAPTRLDLPLTEHDLRAVGAALGHAGVVAVDDSVTRQELLGHLWRFAASESCGACTPCREGTAIGAADPVRATSDDRLLGVLERGSLCAFGRGLPAAVRSLTALDPW